MKLLRLCDEIVEPQKLRMAWVGRELNYHLIPTTCYDHGHHPLDQASQYSIQANLECLQGWGIHI